MMVQFARDTCAPRASCAAGQLLIGLLLALQPAMTAKAAGETTAPATSAAEFRQDAINALPFDQLTEEAQAKVGAVVARPTIYRRLPTERIACDAQMYLLLVRNPDVVVNIWQLMDVTDVTMDCTGPFQYSSDDKAGTLSQIEMLYGTPHTHIFYATTHYEGPMFARPVNARVVLLLRSAYVRGADGAPHITSVMDAFIKIDHLTANLVARTMASVVGKTADHNFVESFRFLARVSETAEENGPGVQQLAMKLERVDPAVRRQFAEVAGAVAQRAIERATSLALPESPPSLGARASTAAPASSTSETATEPRESPSATNAAAAKSLQRGLQLRR